MPANDRIISYFLFFMLQLSSARTWLKVCLTAYNPQNKLQLSVMIWLQLGKTAVILMVTRGRNGAHFTPMPTDASIPLYIWLALIYLYPPLPGGFLPPAFLPPSQQAAEVGTGLLALVAQQVPLESSSHPALSATPAVALRTHCSHHAGCQRGKLLERKRKMKGTEPERPLQPFCILRKRPEPTPETTPPPQPLQCFLQKLPCMQRNTITLSPGPKFCLETSWGLFQWELLGKAAGSSREAEWRGLGRKPAAHGNVLHGATAWLVCHCEWPYCQPVGLGYFVRWWQHKYVGESWPVEKKWDFSRLSSHLGSGAAWQLGFKTQLPRLWVEGFCKWLCATTRVCKWMELHLPCTFMCIYACFLCSELPSSRWRTSCWCEHQLWIVVGEA